MTDLCPACDHSRYRISILAASGDYSPGEVSSLKQTTLQPIRRPSAGSIKDGQLITGATIADESSDEELDLT